MFSAILGTREGAAEGGYRLTSTGVAWTDPAEAAVLRDALAAYKIQNVMLVSAFLAAAALAQSAGHAIGYSHNAMLLIDPEYATVGIVDCTTVRSPGFAGNRCGFPGTALIPSHSWPP